MKSLIYYNSLWHIKLEMDVFYLHHKDNESAAKLIKWYTLSFLPVRSHLWYDPKHRFASGENLVSYCYK